MKLRQTIKNILNNKLFDKWAMLFVIGLLAIIAPLLAYILLVIWAIVVILVV